MTYYTQESSSGQASGTRHESGKEFNVGDTVMYIKDDKKEKAIIILDESPYYEIKFISRNEIKQTVIKNTTSNKTTSSVLIHNYLLLVV